MHANYTVLKELVRTSGGGPVLNLYIILCSATLTVITWLTYIELLSPLPSISLCLQQFTSVLHYIVDLSYHFLATDPAYTSQGGQMSRALEDRGIRTYRFESHAYGFEPVSS